MFTQKKESEILGEFVDYDGLHYQLKKESKKKWLDKRGQSGTEEVNFYQGKERIAPWDIYKIHLDLRHTSLATIQLFLTHYLRGNTNIKNYLQQVVFPNEALLFILTHPPYQTSSDIKEAILRFQNVLDIESVIRNLPQNDKWLVYTQNQKRTVANMAIFEEDFKQTISEYLNTYLSAESLKRYDQIYGGWKNVVVQSIEYYSNPNLLEEIIEKAKEHTENDMFLYEEKVDELQLMLKRMDEEYLAMTSMSEKIRLEDVMKEKLEEEKKIKVNIKDCEEKINRIETYFTTTRPAF